MSRLKSLPTLAMVLASVPDCRWFGSLAGRGRNRRHGQAGFPSLVLYAQELTVNFGKPFTVCKFRSMVANVKDEIGVRLSKEGQRTVNPCVTRVDRLLHKTYLDEIPQL